MLLATKNCIAQAIAVYLTPVNVLIPILGASAKTRGTLYSSLCGESQFSIADAEKEHLAYPLLGQIVERSFKHGIKSDVLTGHRA
ncbi:uncharacterized protein N7511_004159 [Penicillium nucicola]|uniref:uncharacterized protein n=1 Tax=Penicillium nucicola TaxID=1850975 RepID=UPI0025459E30|nr:uncharacterized protein N7511_004159 [Penicillium nucicola]KAJ5766543.1 hypothetical protein N7511_004159 [Penicillium nucicola]